MSLVGRVASINHRASVAPTACCGVEPVKDAGRTAPRHRADAASTARAGIEGTSTDAESVHVHDRLEGQELLEGSDTRQAHDDLLAIEPPFILVH